MNVNLSPMEAATISNAFAQLARVYGQIARRGEDSTPIIDDDLLFNLHGEAIDAQPAAVQIGDDTADDSAAAPGTRRYFGRICKRDGFITDNAAIKRFACSQKELTKAMKAVKVERHSLNARGSHYFVAVADIPYIDAYFRMNK